MTIKGIFKTLIGTMAIMVVSFLVLEIFNISIGSVELRQTTRLAARQACILFTQETYRQAEGGASGAVRAADIMDENGNLYITGDFYGSNDAETIWTNLYNSSSNFASAVDKLDNYYPTVNLIYQAASNSITSAPMPNWESSKEEIKAYDDMLKAQQLKSSMFTPINLGIPYIDKDVTGKMFKWNLAEILSNNKNSLVKVDENGTRYIAYRGFRVYAEDAEIIVNPEDYEVFDMTDSSQKAEFKELTNIDIDGDSSDTNTKGLGYSNAPEFEIDDENKKITVVKLNYSVSCSYEGITPLKQIFEYVWNNEVGGLNGTGREDKAKQSYTYDKQDLVSGGEGSTLNTLPSTGKLIYTLVR